MSSYTVLAIEMVDGEPIETLDKASRKTRERVAVRLTELALHELFDWRLMQTDPNFTNFRYRAINPGGDWEAIEIIGLTRDTASIEIVPGFFEYSFSYAKFNLHDDCLGIPAASNILAGIAKENRPLLRN